MTQPSDHTKQRIVVKLGGNALEAGASLDEIGHDLIALHNDGHEVVLMHGGGPQIDAALETAGIDKQFVRGLRVTTPEAIHLIENVFAQQIQPEILRALARNGGDAIGISGHQHGVLHAELHSDQSLQRVGVIVDVDTSVILDCLADGKIPVISTLAITSDGSTVNVNADTAAAHVAAALKAELFVLLTNVRGIYKNFPDPTSLLSQTNSEHLQHMLKDAQRGMIPKIEACLRALRSGVVRVVVADGSEPHVVRRTFMGEQVGTTVVGYA
jgi:acetylglutamate kinase